MKLFIAILATQFGLNAFAAQWGPAELKESVEAGLELLESQIGSGAFKTVSAISVQRKAQGNAASLTITYLNGTQETSKSYFCHQHGSHIDCH